MKEINLRDYYPFYTTDMIVEVPDEVADLPRYVGQGRGIGNGCIPDHPDTGRYCAGG